MSHGHPESTVATGVEGNPLIGILGHLTKIRGKHHCLGPIVTGLGKEVGIGRPGHIQVGSHDSYEFRIVPISTFTDIGLLTPDFRGSVGQVTVPVVKTQVHAT